MHCFELGGPGCSGHQGFPSLAPHQRSGSPSRRGRARRAQKHLGMACSELRPLFQHFMNPQRCRSQSPRSYTRNLQNLRCRRPTCLSLTKGPSLSLRSSVGHASEAVNWEQTKMVFFYLSMWIKEILHKNLSEFTPKMSWPLKAEK